MGLEINESGFVYNREAINTSGTETRVEIWSGRSEGKLTLSGPTAGWVIFAAVDIDRDDRLDLFINPYASTEREPYVFLQHYPRHSTLSWGLLAHAQPDGTFSLTSPIAKEVAKRGCAEAPSTFPKETELWPLFLHCAKLKGQSPKPLQSLMEKGCSGLDDKNEFKEICVPSRPFFNRVLSTGIGVPKRFP